MKKIILLVAAAGILMCSSCSKTCNCKAKINDEVISETTVELSDGEKCSDHNTSVTIVGQTAAYKCTAQLF